MKSIDIRTTQNVTITYELAEARDRMIAYIIDSVIKAAAILILWLMYNILFSDNMAEAEYFVYIIIVPVVTFYTLFFEVILNGQTPAKKLLRIKVIKLDGRQPGFYDYLIRWTFRILDITLSLGVIGLILMVSSDYAQRMGDMASNSTVVRVSNRENVSLMDILKIDTRHNYLPTYHAVGNFREEDILLIKQTIERYQRFKNEAHRNAVNMLCEKLRAKLEIQDVGPDRIKFLKTIIKDYIVLTR